MARAGLCSRRDAEQWIRAGRVTLNGQIVDNLALRASARDVIAVDGEIVKPPPATRLWLFHKPRDLLTTHRDPRGRRTIFESLPPGLPRVISVGRLDYRSEGLLLLTNNGAMARRLELPATGWARRYRVRAHGRIEPHQLDSMRAGMVIDTIRYRPIEVVPERRTGGNFWLTMTLREGKNREIRRILAHFNITVSRLVRIAYGPFQLGTLKRGAVRVVPARILRDQLGHHLDDL